jgi:DNA-binding FrmR family transcriptional regulator
MLPDAKKSAVRRLKIIHGQIKGLIEAVDSDTYCPDLLIQSLAIQNALKQVDAKLLEGHLKTCAKRQMEQGKTKKVVDELMKIYQLKRKNN